MGSIEYFVPGLAKEIKILVPPDGLKYIFTCVHSGYVPYASHLKTLKQKFRNAIDQNKTLEFTLYDLRPYPTLVKKILTGRKDIIGYFEGMDEGSHNLTLIGGLKEIEKANPELKNKKSLQDLVQHVYDCTVQLGRKENGKYVIWSPGGIREEEIDTTYIKNIDDGEYFTTHGLNEKNKKRFAIRVIENKEVIDGLKELNKLWERLWEK